MREGNKLVCCWHQHHQYNNDYEKKNSYKKNSYMYITFFFEIRFGVGETY